MIQTWIKKKSVKSNSKKAVSVVIASQLTVKIKHNEKISFLLRKKDKWRLAIMRQIKTWDRTQFIWTNLKKQKD